MTPFHLLGVLAAALGAASAPAPSGAPPRLVASPDPAVVRAAVARGQGPIELALDHQPPAADNRPARPTRNMWAAGSSDLSGRVQLGQGETLVSLRRKTTTVVVENRTRYRITVRLDNTEYLLRPNQATTYRKRSFSGLVNYGIQWPDLSSGNIGVGGGVTGYIRASGRYWMVQNKYDFDFKRVGNP